MEVDTISLFWNQLQQQEREYKDLQQQVQTQIQIEKQLSNEVSSIEAEIVEWQAQFKMLVVEVAKKDGELQLINSQINSKEINLQQIRTEVESFEKQVQMQEADVEMERQKMLELVLQFQHKYENEYSKMAQHFETEIEKNRLLIQENTNRLDPIRLDITKANHALVALEEESTALFREISIKEQIFFELADELERSLEIENQQLLMIGETNETTSEYSDVSFLKQMQFIETQKVQMEQKRQYFQKVLHENSEKFQELVHSEAKFRTLYEKIQGEIKELDEAQALAIEKKSAMLHPPFVSQQTMMDQFTAIQDISSITSPPKKKSPYFLSNFNVPSSSNQMQNLVSKTNLERKEVSSAGIVQKALNSANNNMSNVLKTPIVNNLAKFVNQEKENPTQWKSLSSEEYTPKQVKESPRMSQSYPGFQSALHYNSAVNQPKRSNSSKSKVSLTSATPKMKQTTVPQSPKYHFKKPL